MEIVNTKNVNKVNKKQIIANLQNQITIINNQISEYKNSMNTAVIVEPRYLENLPIIIEKFYEVLGKSWNFVFFCGNGLSQKWKMRLNSDIEIRELSVNNLDPFEYSDLFKSKDFWNSLYGEFILTFQADTWILNQAPYDIDFFVKLNKSFIGGNMLYRFPEMCNEKIFPQIRNFNGGLSLRKKSDMLKIIQAFPPQKSEPKSQIMEKYTEDAYFVIAGYKLGLAMGDNEDSSRFAIHNIFYDKCFGIHISRWTNYESDFNPITFRTMIREIYPSIQNEYL